MHTFFINTSGRELENYSDIFEIQHETRRLVSIECPIAEWCDEEVGYEACVRRMGELIDSYKDINNSFNLIVYVDLLSYEKYTSIPMSKHRDRYACLKVLRSLLKHYIKETLVVELNDFGRTPGEVLIIFEENNLPKDGDENSEDGKNMIRSYTSELLGIPSADELDKIIYEDSASPDEAHTVKTTPEEFCKFADNSFTSCIGKPIFSTYFHQFDVFFSELGTFDTCEEPRRRLLERILDCASADDEEVYSVSFVTDRRAGSANKREKTRRDLRLCFYILSCISDESVLDKDPKDDILKAKEFPEIDWDSVVTELNAKGTIYQSKYNETLKLKDSYSKMGLAPSLYAFDNQKFALDEYGRRAKVYEVVDVDEKKKKEQEEKDIENGTISSDDKKMVVISNAQGRSLFSKEEFELFDYTGNKIEEDVLGKRTTPEQYVQAAHKLREHHLEYLTRLRIHVSDAMSNYSGRSSENEPALLRKRKVSIAEEDFDDDKRDYRYTKPGRTEETKKLKTVEDISKTAYTSTLTDYMEFCAGRSVAVTDIEEQCNWFISRIYQISESLRNLKTVAVCLAVAIVLLYMPFVIIQWDFITRGILTVTFALWSIAIPLLLVYLIFVIASIMQRKRYRKAWREFKKKSDEILEENAVAAEKYDQLLTVYIPSLRYVYEYTLDVDFYADCCKMARAKINHHTQKLHDRVVTVGNIIEDLEADGSEIKDNATRSRRSYEDKIDYNVSFCSGEDNRKFYSIFDAHFLESVCKK